MRANQGWHGLAREDIAVLSAFIETTEQQIALSISSFEHGKEVRVCEDSVDPDYPERGGGYEQEVWFNGLSSDEFSLEVIFGQEFPNLHRRSSFLTIYSFFEAQLELTCAMLGEKIGSRLTVKDLRGSDNRKNAEIFLQKVIGISLESKDFLKQELDLIQQLRNRVVHHYGLIENEQLINYVQKHQYLEVGDRNIVLVKNGFLNYVLETFVEYFDQLDKSVSMWWKEKDLH